MEILLENIFSLSEFQRNTKRHLAKLKRSGEAAVLTVNGEAELVVMSAKAYQEMLDSRAALKRLVAIREGLRQADRGEGIDADEAFDEIAKRLGFNLK